MAKKASLYGLAIAVGVRAADVGYYNSTDCVDPTGFSTCYKDADSSYSDCVNRDCKDKNIDCINACECARSTSYIDCAASSCWNQVYNCEYQLTISDYLNFCLNPDLENIPYWPPPDNAPNGCSCPIGKVQLSILNDVNHLEACTNNHTNLDELLSTDDVLNYGEACTCCYQSGILSAIYDICPSTLPSLLGADTYFASLFTDTDWEFCDPYLKAYNCTTELGFSSPADNTTHFYSPEEFPTNGTLSLFDTKGEGEIKTPVSGRVFTWTADGVARTVSAAGVTGTSAAGTGGGAGAVETGAATRTSSPAGISGAASISGVWRVCLVLAAGTAALMLSL
ncbi:uncharacterized protein PAC_08123 [Phialocephala subalpina]|uniref:Extracellular membrane protein CFEM domain-containing protein n=1 Tax=Phialocephala subalpina TaxID=576137 RepID=A0A1L7WZN7_9HELO|nr:uncharacterized protein PAC_08123 [Phialocephala subalpina]